MTAPGSPPAAAPTRRDAAVDAVRGLAVLGSTVATALAWLGGRQLGTGFRPLDGGGLDRAVDAVTGVLVDNRVLPVFALLLGYGVAARMAGPPRPPGSGGPVTSVPPVTSVGPVTSGGPATPGGTVRRRGRHDAPDEREWADGLRRAGALLGLGALHATLVLEVDVLGLLAVMLLLAVPLARARTRTHVLVGVLVVPALLVHGAVDGVGGTLGLPDAPQDYLLSAVDRLGTWLLGLVLLLPASSGLLLAVVAGVRLSRSGWGAQPSAHRRGLLGLGAGAGALGLLGSLPYARVLGAGVLPDVAVGLWSGVIDSVTAPAGALGAVCLGLVATGARGTVTTLPVTSPTVTSPTVTSPTVTSPTVAALSLLGRWSLWAYLAHSVVLALVLAPWAAGAGTRWGSAAVTVVAVALWSSTFVAALVVVQRGDGTAAPSGHRTRARSGSGRAQPTERQGRERRSAT